MNKGEFIKKVAEKAGKSQKDAEAFLNAYYDVVAETLKNGEKIQLVGYGTYESKDKPATEKLNPRTKEMVKVPAHKVPAFKFGKTYKNLFN